MTEKLILKLEKHNERAKSEICKSKDLQEIPLQHINNSLLEVLQSYKNMISPFYGNKKWDKYKKLTNEYECIFMTPHAKNNVCSICPISRSFFKMWELLHDFQTDICFVNENEPIQCLFLAEGPGGFMEAMMRKRDNLNDSYYGMTLRPNHKSVPNWKLNSFTPKQLQQISVLYGEDGTGDIYNLKNTNHLVETLGANSMHFITADGGFDFSRDFNKQEENSFKLISCEVYCAMRMLKRSGTFVVKVYDMFHPNTIHLISYLRRCFLSVHIAKPLTSRPANSEKYLVCCGYDCDEGAKWLSYVKNMTLLENSEQTCYTSDDAMDLRTWRDIMMYNTYYVCRQVYYIQKTIETIELFECMTTVDRIQASSKIIEQNKTECISWCKKYSMENFLLVASP
jgi:23S rRNA U2552 (ribose-2'-O)-methylase RlmE/FtsJ